MNRIFFLLLLYIYLHVFFQENGHDEIIIKAMGRAINKTVMVAELIKVNSNFFCLKISVSNVVIFCLFC